MSSTYSSREVYKLVDQARIETKSDLGRLEIKLDNLENRFAQMEIKQAVSTTKLGLLIAAIALISSTVVTIIINRIFHA